MRALAVSGTKRSPGVPNVPTMQEAGVRGYEAVSWYGMFVPAGTPREAIAKIHAETVRALQKPDVQQRYTALGVEAVGSTPEYLAKYLQAEMTKWADVARRSGLRPE